MNYFNKLTFAVTLVIYIILCFNTSVFAQSPADKFERRVQYSVGDSIQYRLFIPNDLDSSNLYPLILTAHGSGEIGDDNNIHITKWRIAEAWAEDSIQTKYPSFICSPQFPDRPNFDDYSQNKWIPGIISMLDSLSNEFPIDTNRIYMTGLSFGADMTWDFIYKSLPKRFAAAIPLSGGWLHKEVPIITDIPVWAFCGALDEWVEDSRKTVSYVESAGYKIEKRYTKYGDVGLTIDEIILLNQNGRKHIYTEFTDEGHLVWSETYDDPALHYWLFSQQREPIGRKIKTQVLSLETVPKYIPREGDTIKIISEILNPENHELEVNAIIEGVQSSFRDSLKLYDDGLHSDGTPSDNLFANSILLSNLEEEIFDITIRATDLNEPRNISSAYKGHFTTAGPVVLDSFSVRVDQDTIVGILDMHLINMSNSIIIYDVKARIETLDTNVISIPRAELSFSDIMPNENKKRDSGWMYFYAKNNPSEIKLLLEISSNNYPYWYDTLVVNLNPTNIENTLTNISTTFELKQNYPNPFNPRTTIKYSIPQQGNVNLKVFNVLGSEVVTLIKEEQPKGNYEIEFDGSVLSSGIYFYRLQVYSATGGDGAFVETKKMMFVK